MPESSNHGSNDRGSNEIRESSQPRRLPMTLTYGTLLGVLSNRWAFGIAGWIALADSSQSLAVPTSILAIFRPWGNDNVPVAPASEEVAGVLSSPSEPNSRKRQANQETVRRNPNSILPPSDRHDYKAQLEKGINLHYKASYNNHWKNLNELLEGGNLDRVPPYTFLFHTGQWRADENGLRDLDHIVIALPRCYRRSESLESLPVLVCTSHPRKQLQGKGYVRVEWAAPRTLEEIKREYGIKLFDGATLRQLQYYVDTQAGTPIMGQDGKKIRRPVIQWFAETFAATRPVEMKIKSLRNYTASFQDSPRLDERSRKELERFLKGYSYKAPTSPINPSSTQPTSSTHHDTSLDTGESTDGIDLDLGILDL